MTEHVLSGSKPLLLYSLHHPQLSLAEPLAVSLEFDAEADQVVAIAYDLNLFGYRKSEWEALSDLRQTVVDLYCQLQESQNRLGKEATAIWKYLSQVVQS
ncbi:MAG TPA: hypothetical protein ENI60_00295 [Candidatus Fraserbacteria bacterium]|nr:hypothetical protein [Candidatus Fraserbacteria bacterium]